jgi:TonB family protein
MPPAWRETAFVLLACVAAFGCSTTGYVEEHPVDNRVPPLKDGVLLEDAVEVRPKAIREVEPDYPFRLQSVLTGNAVVVFTVLTDGTVADAAVVEADDVQFGEAALAAIRKWRFKPATIKGVPVECRMTMPFVFVSPYANFLPGEQATAPSGKAPAGGQKPGTVEAR